MNLSKYMYVFFGLIIALAMTLPASAFADSTMPQGEGAKNMIYVCQYDKKTGGYEYRSFNETAANARSKSHPQDMVPAPNPGCDVTPPELSGSVNDMALKTSTGSAVIEYSLTATDNRDGSIPVICNYPSGSSLPIGTYTVTCTATDASGNATSTSFTVKIESSWIPPLIVTSVKYLPNGSLEITGSNFSVSCGLWIYSSTQSFSAMSSQLGYSSGYVRSIGGSDRFGNVSTDTRIVINARSFSDSGLYNNVGAIVFLGSSCSAFDRIAMWDMSLGKLVQAPAFGSVYPAV